MPFLKTRDNVALYYEVHGNDEQTIIFSSGGGCSSRHFRHNVKALSEHTRLVLWDYRGHGRSEHNRRNTNADLLADDLDDLMRTLNIEHAFLAGWSAGVFATLAYTRKYGYGKVDALLLVDMSPSPRATCKEELPLSWGGNTDGVQFYDTLKSVLNGEKPTREQLYQIYYMDRPGMEENLDWLEKEYDLVYPPYRLSQIIMTATDDYREDLKMLPVPLAYFSGGRGMFPDVHTWYKENVPDVTIYRYEKAPHSLFMYCHEEFNRDFMAFVDKHMKKKERKVCQL